MFIMLFSAISLAFSFVIPLYKSFALLSDKQDPFPKQILESISGTVTIPKKKAEALQECVAYWMILSIGYYISSIRLVTFLGDLIPFNYLLLLYVRAWLVFPMVSLNKYQNNETDAKVTGTFIIYHYYLYHWLEQLTAYINESVVLYTSSYNDLVDKYASPMKFLKIQPVWLASIAPDQKQAGSSNTIQSGINPGGNSSRRSFSQTISDMLGKSAKQSTQGSNILSSSAAIPVTNSSSFSNRYSKEATEKESISMGFLADCFFAPLTNLSQYVISHSSQTKDSSNQDSNSDGDTSFTSSVSSKHSKKRIVSGSGSSIVDGFDMMNDVVIKESVKPEGKSASQDVPITPVTPRSVSGASRKSSSPQQRKSSWIFSFRSFA